MAGASRQISLLLSAAITFFWPIEASPQAKRSAAISPSLQTTSEDQQKAEDLILSDGLYRVIQKQDSTLAFALVQMQRAKTPDDVSRIFKQSITNGQADPEFDRDVMVPLIKKGVQVFTKGPLTDAAVGLVDGLNEFTKEIEQGQKSVKLSGFPPEYASAAFAGAVSQLSPEARLRFTQELAAYLKRDYDGVLQGVREKRILAGPDSLDRKMYTDQVNAITARLDVEKQLLDAQLKGIQAAQDLQNRKVKLESESEHLKAGVTLVGLALGPIVGAETANKVTSVGNNFVQMNQAIKQFGPGGISPDKLLMFTNVVTAGIAIVGIVASSSQQDPTLVALQGIMKQLEEIKKQLDRIENKVDDLTDIVLLGFDRVLKGQQVITNELQDFRNVVTTQINDEAQLKAIRIYLDYLDHGSTDYALRLQCANPNKKSAQVAKDCLGVFAQKFSTKMLFTNTPDAETRPEIWSSEWSNQTLSLMSSENEGALIAVQQLSYPFYFAQTPAALSSTVARNHELIAAYGKLAIGTPHSATMPNPEILAMQLRTYLSAAKEHKEFHTGAAGDLTDQALNRINQVDDLLATTLRDKQATDRLFESMGADLTEYQNKAKSVFDQLSDDPYTEERSKFNSKGTNLPGVITYCPGDGEPSLPIPKDAKGGLDAVVPQIFWIAQEMSLGTLGQCYEWAQVRESRKSFGGGAEWYQIKFTLRAYFNPSPKLLDSKISTFEFPANARRWSKNSLPITVRSLATKNHYSTWWGSTAPIFSSAWIGTAVSGGEHDIFECFENQMELNSDCITDPSRFIPRDRFVQESVETLSDADIGKTRELVERGVQTVLAAVITNRSGIWDQYRMSPIETSDSLNKNLSSRPVTKETFLSEALREYTRKFLLAEGWMLTSFYHQNPVSLCWAQLDAYSPKRVTKMVADSLMAKDQQPIGEKFTAAMTSAMKDCRKHELHPDLQRLRERLNQLRKTQVDRA